MSSVWPRLGQALATFGAVMTTLMPAPTPDPYEGPRS